MTIVVGILTAGIEHLENRPAQSVNKRGAAFLSEDALAKGEAAIWLGDSQYAGRLGHDLPLTKTETVATTFMRFHPAHVEPAGPVTDRRRVSLAKASEWQLSEVQE